MPALEGEWDAYFNEEDRRRRGAGLARSIRTYEHAGPHLVTDDGRRLLNFSSNDYLGLSEHPALRQAAASAAARRSGSGASRLVTGTSRACADLEERLAMHQGRRAALVFGSGYLANLGVISALVGRDDAIVSDKLNHASIIDGCRLSRAALYRYRHGDVDELEAMLALARKRRARRILVVTESVFSMDGDVAPLAEIIAAKDRHGAFLLLDEAHAEGVFGPRGEGYAHELGLNEGIDCHLGTFSKAYGAYGAYVAGSRSMADHLINASRTFIFTTALPPAVIGSIAAAIDVVEEADEARLRLRRHGDRFRAGLAALGADTAASSTQIVPVIVGEAELALGLSRSLEEAGVLAVAVRTPTVPVNTARLRFSLSAAHRDEEVDAAVQGVADALAGSAGVSLAT